MQFSASTEPQGDRAAGSPSQYWYSLFGVLAAALIVRMAFFTGFMGTDEVTYTAAALKIANGEWGSSNYLGAMRYGINLPNALFIKLFGASEYSANLWSLLCSAGEVVLVFAFAHRLWGLRGALLCAAVIGVLPLHVHLAGRLLADAPVAFFITLSFFLFWIAERRGSATWYVATGLAAGCVFWIKEVLPVYCMTFAVYALVYRTWNFKWAWTLLGGALMVAANSLLMWGIAGDPLHIFKLVRTATESYITESYIDLWRLEDSPSYYLRYLFADGRHTWLMGYLAIGGIILWARAAIGQRLLDSTTGYVVTWALGLFAVFSIMPISVSPLTFLAKQTNYMAIFLAPFCMLSGYFLASMPRRWMVGLVGAYAVGAVALSGLEQQAIRVFTANSRATVEFARAHAETPVYAMSNAYRAGLYVALFDKGAASEGSVKSVEELFAVPGADARDTAPSGLKGYAVVDLESMDWGKGEAIRRVADVPPCWHRTGQLEPAPGSGLGYLVAAGMVGIGRALPLAVSARATPRFEALVRPKPAYLYEVPSDCVPDAGSQVRK